MRVLIDRFLILRKTVSVGVVCFMYNFFLRSKVDLIKEGVLSLADCLLIISNHHKESGSLVTFACLAAEWLKNAQI